MDYKFDIGDHQYNDLFNFSSSNYYKLGNSDLGLKGEMPLEIGPTIFEMQFGYSLHQGLKSLDSDKDILKGYEL